MYYNKGIIEMSVAKGRYDPSDPGRTKLTSTEMSTL